MYLLNVLSVYTCITWPLLDHYLTTAWPILDHYADSSTDEHDISHIAPTMINPNFG